MLLKRQHFTAPYPCNVPSVSACDALPGHNIPERVQSLPCCKPHATRARGLAVDAGKQPVEGRVGGAGGAGPAGAGPAPGATQEQRPQAGMRPQARPSRRGALALHCVASEPSRQACPQAPAPHLPQDPQASGEGLEHAKATLWTRPGSFHSCWETGQHVEKVSAPRQRCPGFVAPGRFHGRQFFRGLGWGMVSG